MKAWGKLQSLTQGFPSLELYENEEVFGRNNSRMKISFPVVSGNHFIIKRMKTHGDYCYLISDTSTNGTYLNHEGIGRGKTNEIKNYDEISVLKKGIKENINYIFIVYKNVEEEMMNGGPQELYELSDLCGVGNFAIVRKVKEISTGEYFAMKIIDLEKAKDISSRPNAILDECKILQNLDHQNIIKLKEIFQTKKYLYMIIELIEGGELFDQIIAETFFTEEKCRTIMKQMFSALEYLHSQNIIHRDLKPENILCSKDNKENIKITDFGLSRIINPETLAKTMCGTPLYVAPEILSGTPYNGTKVDVWSCGVILYVLACGFPPFHAGDGEGNRVLFDNICSANYEFRSPYWDKKSKELMDLIKHMLIVDVDKRYSIEQCINHPFMTGKKLQDKKEKKRFEEEIEIEDFIDDDDSFARKRSMSELELDYPDSKRKK